MATLLAQSCRTRLAIGATRGRDVMISTSAHEMAPAERDLTRPDGGA
jgi:hypothetical protein